MNQFKRFIDRKICIECENEREIKALIDECEKYNIFLVYSPFKNSELAAKFLYEQYKKNNIIFFIDSEEYLSTISKRNAITSTVVKWNELPGPPFIFECPQYVTALLAYIKDELDIMMKNNTQEEYDSPFLNTGNSFKCDVFEVKAYNWNEENDYNFKYHDIEISWYKHFKRGAVINKIIRPQEAINMFNDCLKYIKERQ